MNQKPMIILTGPTAVGKSALSVELAKKINGAVISADSMQVYRHMDIGSAKIMPEEMQGITHYMIDELEPDEEFHVVRFTTMAKEYLKEADLVIYVVDSSRELSEEDHDIIKMIEDRNTIVLLNKSDLTPVTSREEMEKLLDKKVISVSAKEHLGIDELEETIKTMFFHGKLEFNDEVYITNVRHKAALKNACDSLAMVRKSIADGMPEDFYSIDLMSAYEELGKIIGEAVDDDLVNEIFSKFCMGK